MTTPKGKARADRAARTSGQMNQDSGKKQDNRSMGQGARADAHRDPSGGYRQGDTMAPSSRGGHRPATGNDAGLDGPSRRDH